jgi:hypothetical protein
MCACKVVLQKLKMFVIIIQGKFIVAYGPESGEAYEVSAEYKFDFEKTGKYEIKFRVIMQCSEEDCKKSDDFFNINSNTQTTRGGPQFLENINVENLNQFNKWVEKTVIAEINNEEKKKFQVKFL